MKPNFILISPPFKSYIYISDYDYFKDYCF